MPSQYCDNVIQLILNAPWSCCHHVLDVLRLIIQISTYRQKYYFLQAENYRTGNQPDLQHGCWIYNQQGTPYEIQKGKWFEHSYWELKTGTGHKPSQVTSCTAHMLEINILYISALSTCILLRGQGDERIIHKDATTCVRIWTLFYQWFANPFRPVLLNAAT